ncbi:hypothetical protein R3P38DRAFT_3482212 [Favolaschia claudopus]|uniref:Uncharacterized protein n=1 Tax=Favolaschia claudopus TaxID=2862362 RepID=A0AAV9Z8X4_9AGAR
MDSVPPSFPRRSHYHSERPWVPSHFPDRNDRSACARFRLARKRRTYAASPSSSPAAISSEVKLWREVLSLRQHFNELSALMLEQAHNIAALLKLQDNSPPTLPSFLTQHKPSSTAAHPIPESGDATIDIIGDEPAPVAQPLQSTVYCSAETSRDVQSDSEERFTVLALQDEIEKELVDGKFNGTLCARFTQFSPPFFHNELARHWPRDSVKGLFDTLAALRILEISTSNDIGSSQMAFVDSVIAFLTDSDTGYLPLLAEFTVATCFSFSEQRHKSLAALLVKRSKTLKSFTLRWERKNLCAQPGEDEKRIFRRLIKDGMHIDLGSCESLLEKPASDRLTAH